MGCPHVYYIRALQMLAHTLAYEGNPTLAKDLSKETNAERLERYILLKKSAMSDKEFYYIAGRATQTTVEEAYQAGCDPLNAAISGIDLFENFIGLEARDE